MEHNCEIIFQKIMLLLDNELSQEEQDWLRDQLIDCPACLENYEMEKDFKELICEKLKCIEPCGCDETDLKAKILAKIQAGDKLI
jgi:hypothetical protein